MTRLRTLLTATAMLAAATSAANAASKPSHEIYRYGKHNAQPAETYNCSLIRAFPEPDSNERNPVTSTTVTISGNSRIYVQHTLASGVVKTRNDQYAQNYKQTSENYDEGQIVQWTGKHHSSSMKGQFTNDTGTAYYSEELRDDGKLSWAGVWSCSFDVKTTNG